MSNYYISKCCNAQVQNKKLEPAEGFAWFTNFCTKCDSPCDIYPVIDKN